MLGNPSYAGQYLGLGGWSDRDDQPSSNRELDKEGLRHLRGAGGDDDSVVGRMFRPAEGAVTFMDNDIGVSQQLEALSGAVRQSGQSLDTVHGGHDPAQNGSGITGSGADLQYPIRRDQFQCLGHVCHYVWLRGGLSLIDGKRVVPVRLVP